MLNSNTMRSKLTPLPPPSFCICSQVSPGTEYNIRLTNSHFVSGPVYVVAEESRACIDEGRPNSFPLRVTVEGEVPHGYKPPQFNQKMYNLKSSWDPEEEEFQFSWFWFKYVIISYCIHLPFLCGLLGRSTELLLEMSALPWTQIWSAKTIDYGISSEEKRRVKGLFHNTRKQKDNL